MFNCLQRIFPAFYWNLIENIKTNIFKLKYTMEIGFAKKSYKKNSSANNLNIIIWNGMLSGWCYGSIF